MLKKEDVMYKKIIYFLIIIFSLCNLWIIKYGYAQDKTELKIGLTKVILPFLNGFIKIKEDAPLRTFYAENFIPSSNKLLALYLSKKDYNELLYDNDLDFNKYIVVQYFKKDEYQNIDEKKFKKFVKETKLSFSNSLNNDSDELKKFFNNLENKFDLRVNIGELINLGKLM